MPGILKTILKDKNIINLSSMVSTYIPPLSKWGREKIVPLAKGGEGCRIYKTLEISLPDRFPEFFHSFSEV